MNIHTTRFGQIAVQEDKVLQFPEGLPGFPEEKQFTIIDMAPDSPIQWLQSVTTPEVAFPIADPFVFFPRYEFSLADEHKRKLQVEEPHDLFLFVILTIPKDVRQSTANLRAPVLINRHTRTGFQIILDREDYSIRQPLLAENRPPSKGAK